MTLSSLGFAVARLLTQYQVQPMIDWGLCAALIIVAVIGIGIAERTAIDWVRRRRLIASGRYISCQEAIAAYRQKNGEIIFNRSTLPGKWWFLFVADLLAEKNFRQNVQDRGMLIYPLTKRDVQELDRIEGTIELSDGFED